MKFGVITLLSLLGLSSNYATADSNKEWTVIDPLKDGYDAVYKYENSSQFSSQDFNYFKGQTFDVPLRKLSEDDPKKFLMHLKKVQLQGDDDHPPTDADMEALLEPIILCVGKENMKFDIYATQDTRKSLNWKYMTLVMLLHNRKDKIKGLESRGFSSEDVEMSGVPFGKCKETVNLEFSFIIIMMMIIIMRCSFKMKGKLLNEQETTFALGNEVHFDNFRKIKDVCDESRYTIVYGDYEFQ